VSAPTPAPWIGRAVRRREDPRLLRGEGRYLADLALPGMLHLAFVRSPHAHARVRAVDPAPALDVPGVVAVFTAADLALAPITAALRDARYRGGSWPPLAREVVRFVGEPVAVVAAADRYLAEDAAERVAVTYEPLPAVAALDAALAPDAPQLHPDVPGNRFLEREVVHGDVETAFARAAVVVRGTFRHSRVAGAPLEGRGVAAAWEPPGRLTVWASTQTPHHLKEAVARGLGLAAAQVRVVVPDVGGGFGPKMMLYPEDLVTCAVAQRLRRPVKWVEDRRENLLAMTQAREVWVEAEAAADAAGRLLAVRATLCSDAGAYSAYPLTVAIEPVTAANILTGPYRVEAYACRALAVATNKAPLGAYRGVGMAVAAWVMERLVDKVAARLGLDPAEVRRRNLIPPEAFPYTNPAGLVYDSGRLHETLAAALEAFDYAGARRAQAEARAAGRRVGIGLAVFTEFTGMGSRTFLRRGMTDMRGYDGARVQVEPDGTVRLWASSPSQGQGHETAFAQLLADELGIDPELVVVAPVDTDLAPEGSGTFASRALVASGGAVVRAAARVRAKAVAIAARLLEAAPEDIVLDGGRFFVRGTPARALTWRDVARAAHVPALGYLAGGEEPGLGAVVTYDPPPAAFGNGAHAALVEVDPQTGTVHVRRYVVAEDCGPLLNPLLVEGQTHGGVAQGLGEALYEALRYDAAGQPLATTFMDYLLPSAAEVPPVEVRHLATPSPYTERGFKGVGESGTIGAVGCLANAVSDALGRDVDVLPIAPALVLALLRGRSEDEAAREERPGTGAASGT